MTSCCTPQHSVGQAAIVQFGSSPLAGCEVDWSVDACLSGNMIARLLMG